MLTVAREFIVTFTVMISARRENFFHTRLEQHKPLPYPPFLRAQNGNKNRMLL